MRVLLLATRYFGFGGAEGYTRCIARAVAESGADLDVLSLRSGEVIDQPCPGRYLGDLGLRSTRATQVRFAARALARARGYDLLICSHVSLAPIGLAVSRVFRLPYVVIGYGIDVWGGLPAARRVALRRAIRVITVSHFTARMVVEAQGVPAERARAIHPIVEPALLALAAAPDPHPGPSSSGGAVTLLTVARLSAQERYKGFETVMAALPAAAAAAGPVRYVIVGDGDDAPRLQAIAREMGVSEMVHFAGAARDTNDLGRWYRASDIFVMPSVCEERPGGWAGEGFGIVFIEASAFGRPVIVGDGGGAPETVQDGATGLLVDGRDQGSVTTAIVRLANNAPLRARMGDAGRRWVQEYFTFGRLRRETEALLREATALVQPGAASGGTP